MPMAIPLALGIGGSLLGGIGGAGKQSSQKGTSDQTQEGTQKISQEEQAYFGQGREDIVSQLMASLQRAQQPVYGQATKAGVYNDLNELANDSIGKLRSQLGGRVHSGSADRAVRDIEQQRFGNLSGFLTGLPQQESQTQYDRTLGLLGPAMGFFGQAPRSQTTTSSTKSSGTSESSAYGPSVGRGFLSNLGGLFGDWAEKNSPFGGG